jgi:nitrate reductase gamma subunit
MTPAYDLLLFAVLPYAATVLCLVATVERFLRHGSSITSMSSQLLENRLHFWALVPFHAGILIVLLGHLVAFVLPSTVLAWNAQPLRLYFLEGAAFAGGLLALGGFIAVTLRRIKVAPLRQGTHWLDWIVYAVLIAQLATGVLVAVLYPWGSSWFAAAAAPYVRSLVLLQPDMAMAAAMPVLAQLHLTGTWVLVALFPFSRLVHILVVPNPYLWRAPQVVRWNRRPALVHGRKP